MADNQEVYQHELDAGNKFLLREDWPNAILAFNRLIQEQPQLVEAQLGLGNALLGLRRFTDALHIFEHVKHLVPNDPTIDERVGFTLERLGRLREAAQLYLAVAEVYYSEKHDIEKAIFNWECAANIVPELSVHLKIAKAYEEIGRAPKGSTYRLFYPPYESGPHDELDRPERNTGKLDLR